MRSAKTLSYGTKASYGLGHMLNDMTASLWFTYTLLYFHNVLALDNSYAGLVLLSGQASDAVATLLVGVLADKLAYLPIFSRYGKRKSWHLIGTLLAVSSVPFLFLPCQGCSSSPAYVQVVYYTWFAFLSQTGWACIQISHLSLIPEVAASQDERIGLTAVRYSMTVVSNILVYLLAWRLLGAGHSSQKITPADQNRFRNLMLAVVAIGGLASLAFHASFQEKSTNNLFSDQYETLKGSSKPAGPSMSVKQWLFEPQFYAVSFIYMSARLFVNLSQAYVPLYVQLSLQLPATLVAIIPLVMFLSGFFISVLMKPLNRLFGRKLTYFIGSLLGLASSLLISYSRGEMYAKYGVFFVAGLLGVAGTTLLVASLSLIAELISNNTDSSAFVYGAMSFADKLANGGGIMLIQYIANKAEDTGYFRDVLASVTGGPALMGALLILTLAPVSVGDRWRDKRPENHETTPLLA